jgi:hypothetical protein
VESRQDKGTCVDVFLHAHVVKQEEPVYGKAGPGI